MAFLHVEADGVVRQFVWNRIAEMKRLTGVTATNTYTAMKQQKAGDKENEGGVKGAISLLYMGKQWGSIPVQSWAR